jgi:hypothetical protein
VGRAPKCATIDALLWAPEAPGSDTVVVNPISAAAGMKDYLGGMVKTCGSGFSRDHAAT